MSFIHPTAVIHPESEVAEGVEIGPYCVVGSRVRIESGCKLASHVVLQGPLTMGKDNFVDHFASLGGAPQHLTSKNNEDSLLKIGAGNIIREHVTLSRGTREGGGITSIGDHNLIMAMVHIGHDCKIGSHTIIASGTGIAGHVVLEDYVYLSGLVGISQRCHIGKLSYVVGFTGISRDIPPFTIAAGSDEDRRLVKIFGINSVGLQRRNYSPEVIGALRKAFKILFHSGMTIQEAISAVREQISGIPEVDHLTQFIENSECGIAPRGEESHSTQQAAWGPRVKVAD
ncbi:MAG: acyl-ACP--UDP-N-acetylglucosamine O-acyltransferase [Deltaproteobacteria bacterium]|nr:acyl-ACP--UDP-N-acetylglucosamine O-acyltransferase [Deltaproteobacteria bacterium]